MLDATVRHAAVIALLLAAVPAQSWALIASGPPHAFGFTHDLVVYDGVGMLALDEAAATTFLPQGSGWTAVPAALPARLGATLVAGTTLVYAFGGLTASGLDNTTWRFDRPTQTWSALAATGAPPSPRAGARAAALAGSWPIVCFGGTDGSLWPNDTHVLVDLLGVAWWTLLPSPPAMVGRIGHAMAPAPGNGVILFGGQHTQPLGDTWLFSGSSWTQYLGSAPPAAAWCQMVYDSLHDVTVLVHPNGETWEWNGFVWRRVGATGAPPWTATALVYEEVTAKVIALRATASSLDTHEFTPSPARFELATDAVCSAAPGTWLELTAFERSLPILGQTLHLRATGLLPSGLLVGVIEFSTTAPLTQLGCNCQFALSGANATTQFVAGTGSVRDWLLPIANVPALIGVPIDAQGLAVDAAAPCFLLATQRGQITCGL